MGQVVCQFASPVQKTQVYSVQTPPSKFMKFMWGTLDVQRRWLCLKGYLLKALGI